MTTHSTPNDPPIGDEATSHLSDGGTSGTLRGLHRRLTERWLEITLAVVAYVPLLLTAPGQISADTKAYLYLDPSRLLDRAWLMWNTNVNAGTVVHQNIGYLFPLGPYYWLMRSLHMPTWIAERLCFGTILFLAGYGTVWMLRRLDLKGPGVAVGAFTYMLSPYVLAYFGRTSVILLPWTALPWLIGLLALALRERTWRAPVLIALVVTLMSGTNASSVIFVLVAPALLVPYMIWITREVNLRDAIRALLRIGVATAPAQLWWVAGLWVQGSYGLPILQLTETVKTVALTSTAPELLRGLGYWYFYGRDGLSQWTESSTLYTQNLVMLVLGFILPILGLLGAMFTRWRYRAYFVMLIVVGLVAGIGTYPYNDPAPFGDLVKETTKSAAGLALRNSSRALPLLVLGLATLLATSIEPASAAIRSRLARPRQRFVAPVMAVGLILISILGLPPLWTGTMIQNDLQFPDPLPEYWTEAARAIDATTDGSRVLELPGTDFYAYRWGQTQDPITPGIIDRPWVGRELTAYGTPPGVDLLRALDVPIQESIFEPASVAPIARLFGASDVLLRMDTQYERYHAPRPADLWREFGGAEGLPALGLAAPQTFGHPTPFLPDPRQPTVDEYELARSTLAAPTPPLALYPVSGARSIVRVQPTSDALVVWGDGSGLVNAAGAGMLGTTGSILYASTLATNASIVAPTRAGTPQLLVTDTNRRQGSRWATTRENTGATEAAGSVPLIVDPRDTRLETFPGIDDSYRSVAEYGPDVANVRATRYGVDGAFSIGARPVNAIDGDPRTVWTAGDADEVIGDRIVIDYKHPVTADHIDVQQLDGNRHITTLDVILDGQFITAAQLGDASFTRPGQRIELGGNRTFTSLELRVADANVKHLVSFSGISNVGLREITVPGVSAAEWIRVPSAGLDTFGAADSPLSFLFTRLRANPLEGYRQDPELHIARIFTTPRPTRLLVNATARLSGTAPSQTIDAFLGRPGTNQGYAWVDGDLYLFGDLRARPSSALDGDPTTAWVTPFGPQIGSGFKISNPSPTRIDRMKLSVIADGRHSVPTSLRLTGDDGTVRDLAVPDITDAATPGAITTVDLAVEPFVSTGISVTITGERAVDTKDPFTGQPHALPVAIVELGLPHLVGPLPSALPDVCRSGLMAVDGTDIPVRITGSIENSLSRDALVASPCANPVVELAPGDHTFTSANGLDTGVDIDQTTLSSRFSSANTSSAADSGSSPGSVPTIVADATGRLSYRVSSTGASGPYWLVLGQSLSDGWTATVRGGASLGAPTLIDGLSNGWLIDPAIVGDTITIDLVWAPQKTVNIALIVSGIWLLILLVAATWYSFRRRSDLVASNLQANSMTMAAPQPIATSWSSPTTPTPVARLLTILVSGLLAGIFGGVLVGVIVALITTLASSRRRARILLLITPVICMSGVIVLYVGLQIRRRIPVGVEWVNGFLFAHELTLIAVFSVVAETLLRFASRIRPKRA